MVASAAPGDGKTTVARHLAAAAARMGSRVLLLEADLRRPTIALQLDVASGPGVADVLIGAAIWTGMRKVRPKGATPTSPPPHRTSSRWAARA